MEARVGVVRDEAGLREAVARLAPLSPTCDAALVALLVAHTALGRRESRGAHWRSDFSGSAPARHSEITLGTVLAEIEPAARAAAEALAR
ncbi:hypothetical protein [Methylobacterium gregans]